MDADHTGLLQRWFDLAHRAGVRLAAATDMVHELVAAYGDPHRHYHDLDHVASCIRHVENAPLAEDDRVVAELALWFHDVVYDPTRADNEERSAALADAWLAEQARRLDATQRSRVGQLILMTAGHRLGEEADDLTRLVHDVDLAILGEDADCYDEYAAAIRAEYAHVPDEAFVAGRAQVLEAMLACDPLYATPGFRQAFEAQARANLERELHRLRAAASSPVGDE